MKKFFISLIIILPLLSIGIFSLALNVAGDVVAVSVESIEFEQTTAVTNLGERTNLAVNVLPQTATNKAIVWKSSDDEIAIVTPDGDITFLNFGSVYITATSLDGNHSTSCYFVVTDTAVHQLLLYTINHQTEIARGETLQIYSEILPAEALNKQVVFTSMDESVATVNELGKVSALKSGSTTIVGRSVDGEKVASLEIEVFEEITSLYLQPYNLIEKSYHQLDLKMTPINADINRINFTVDNPNIATVNYRGVVVFSSAGIVNVTASYKTLQTVTQLEYTAGYASNLFVETVSKTIDFSALTWQISYTTLPSILYATEVNFTSSNTKVATVGSTGLVLFEGGGLATITASVQKSDGSFIKRAINLYVVRKAEQVVAESFVTGVAQSQIQVSVLPIDSSVSQFYYEVENGVATVDESGKITFNQAATAQVTIYAENKSSGIFKTIEVEYTGGFAKSLFVDETINLEKGERKLINVSFLPTNTQNKNLSYEILETQNNNGTTQTVVEISSQGMLEGKSGGRALVRVNLETQSSFIYKTVWVTVFEKASQIVFDLPLEKYNDEYLSASQIVSFTAEVLSLSATDKDIKFSVNDNHAARIVEDRLIFNYPSVIKLTATNLASGVESSVFIRHTTTVVFAEFKQVEKNLRVGQSTRIELESYLPSALNVEVFLQVVSQSSKISSQIASVVGNEIYALYGGEVSVNAYVSGIYQKTFNFNFERLGESVEVYPQNIQITEAFLHLNYVIQPLDTTSQTVVWTVDDLQIAVIENDVLIFNDFGKVFVTATIADENARFLEFFIERIQDEQNVSYEDGEHTMFVGENIQLEHGENDTIEILENQGNIALSSAGVVSALSAGNAVVKITHYNLFGFVLEVFELKIMVLNYVTDILLTSNDLTLINGQYVTAAAENILSYSLVPSQNVKQGISFELLSTTLAEIVNGTIVFYAEGIVTLKATSEDGRSFRLWTIRYTGGNAIGFEANQETSITLNKGTSIQFQIVKYLPQNTKNKNFTLEIVGSIVGVIEIDGSNIVALKGGSVQIVVRLLGGVTRFFDVVVIETLEQILWENNSVIIVESTYKLNPTLLPSTATHKSIIYQTSDEDIANIINGYVVFSKPGKVEIFAISENNQAIRASFELTSTMGLPNQIVLNATYLEIMVGDTAQVYVSSFSPHNAQQFELRYTLLTQSQSEVVSLNQAGKVTAIKSGTATIKVSVENDFGLDIFQTVEIEVYSQITALDIRFEEELEIFNNAFITSKPKIKFEVIALPEGLQIGNYAYKISNQALTCIVCEEIIFDKIGVVTIVFESIRNPEIKKPITINYVGNTFLKVEVDETEFGIVSGAKRMQVAAGTSFEFEILKKVPNNLEASEIILTQISAVQNYSALSVSSATNGKISFLNGGIVTYNLQINGFNLGNFTFEVIQKANEIVLERNSISISSPSFSIVATVLPLDTTDMTLMFTSSNESVALVNAYGMVEFLKVGEVQIVIENPSSALVKVLTIKYTREIETLAFAETAMTLAQNSTIVLSVITSPIGIDSVIEFSSNNTTIATVNNDGRIITKDKSGEFTITARLASNPQIKVSKTFLVINYSTKLALELDSVDDDKGIAGQRVFGNKFVNNQNVIINTYQMKVLSVTPSNYVDILVWNSSNEEIATVNESGLVTFKGTGKVTIRVEPLNQYNPAKPLYDSYTFTIVEGVNIRTLKQYMVAHNASENIVFQNNIGVSISDAEQMGYSTLRVKSNLYGNGHTLSLTGFNQNEYKMLINGDGIIIDNLRIRGEEVPAGIQLTAFSKFKSLLLISNSKDIIIKNSILENAQTIIKVSDSKVLISGSILQNSGHAHLILAHEANSMIQSVVTVKNAIFKDALLAAILFDFDKSSSQTYASKLIMQENVYIYNFRQPEEVISEGLISKAPEILQTFIVQYRNELLGIISEIKHTYNNKAYYHMGIIMLDVDYIVGKDISYGSVNMTGLKQNPYKYYVNSINIAGISGTVRAYTVMPGNTLITPASTYDSSIYKDIRDV